jgi:radical SAM protein with 4Fe4S-binding SPASM domain
MRSIRALDAGRIQYGIRMTVTPATLERLPEGVLLLCNETGTKTVQVEASFTAERGVYSDLPAEACERFATAFLEAVRIGAERGVFVSYSGARPWIIAHAFCQAPTRALIATPEGRLVACFEAAGDGHPYADDFTIGHVTRDGIERDSAAYERFLLRQEARRSACGDCFCYWHCCGDCASRAMVSPAPQSMRCSVNRDVTKRLILGDVVRGEGLWMGGG